MTARWWVECPNCFLERKEQWWRERHTHHWFDRENRQPLQACASCGKPTEWRTKR